ncbi:TPA: F41 fimbrial protein [Escherichia coli]|nr:K88 fimbrial protein AC precursor [Escherichia coli]HAN4552862.1 F41 fimbrial protein [Escherichia coli]
MKKTLIALAVAASAVVSGSAMAALGGWTEDQPGGNIDFGGTITRPAGEVKWLWAVGEGFDSYQNLTSDLVDGGKRLNVAVQQDMPLLAAKMKEAVIKPILGIGAIPKVTFSSFDSTPIAVNFIDESHATMEVKVKNKDKGDLIGNITIPFEYGASGTVKDLDESDAGKVNASSFWTGGTGTMFEGLVKPDVKAESSQALKWNGVTVDDIYAAMKAVGGDKISGPGEIAGSWVNMSDLSHGNYTRDNYARYFTYGAGIPSGNNLSVVFDNPVTQTTEWLAPITVTVIYS